MKTNQHQWNWMMDAVLLGGFLITFFRLVSNTLGARWQSASANCCDAPSRQVRRAG